ncbi:MAG: MYXO-CTERM sorting domain-containing protein [Myxococcaceae bacterium]
MGARDRLPPEGCGCAGAPSELAASGLLLLALGALGRRRRTRVQP